MNTTVTAVVVVSHFLAAFTALGLPPYLTEALHSLGDPEGRWAGILYILPTTCIALSAPFWGRVADRFGPRKMLIRAQLGLALSYFLTSQSSSVGMLAVSLIVQGLLGGTFSASSAFLGAHLQGKPLSAALTLMQSSARMALLVAPVTVGLLIQHHSILELYRFFCVLPLLSAFLTLWLPEQKPNQQTTKRTRGSLRGAGRMFWMELLFVLSTILSFPYFIEQVKPLTPLAWVPGLLFALPHFAYLLAVPVLNRISGLTPLAVGFVLVGFTLLGHIWATNLMVLGVLRLLLGVGMAICIMRINDQAAELARVHPSGQLFGVLEAYGKAGAVLAGVLSSLLSPDPLWTYWLAGTVALASITLTLLPERRHDDHTHPQT